MRGMTSGGEFCPFIDMSEIDTNSHKGDYDIPVYIVVLVSIVLMILGVKVGGWIAPYFLPTKAKKTKIVGHEVVEGPSPSAASVNKDENKKQK